MPWTAVIGKSPEAQGAFSGSIDVNVTFTDGNVSFTRSYNFHAENFPTVKSVEDHLRSVVLALEQFDQMKALIDEVRKKVGVISTGVVSVDPEVDLKDAATLEAAAEEIKEGKK